MKNVIQKFIYLYKCSILIFEYVRDIPILSISLFAIFIDWVSLKIYYHYFTEEYDLRKLLIFISISVLVNIVCVIVYCVEFSRRQEREGLGSRSTVQILFVLVLLLLRLVLCVSKDFQNGGDIEGFTEVNEPFFIEIGEVSKSKGDKQEIVFKYEGVKGIGYVNWFENIKIGDVCEVYGELSVPENFQDFDYRGYLRNKDIFLYGNRLCFGKCEYEMNYFDISSYVLSLKRALREFRDILSRNIDMNLPEPQSSLLVGILFGSERAFSEDFENYLRISGTTHIIAASGYNVTILILLCSRLSGFLKKKSSLIFSLVAIWLFCIFSGLGASILRATVMGSITILALISGNVRNIHILIPMGILILILINPKILFDIGFQLSILATLGLVYLMPSMAECVKRVFGIKKVFSWVQDFFLSTLSCTLATLPVSISIFGKVSLVSVFANVIILPLTGSTMLYGVVALVFSFISRTIGHYLFSIPYFQLKVFEKTVSFFGALQWGYIDVENSLVGVVIGLFLIFFCMYFYPTDEENYYVKKYYSF
ncbi:ComEC family competence protein [bacterium]|nr:ComEC family competence protein [bacterium]